LWSKISMFSLMPHLPNYPTFLYATKVHPSQQEHRSKCSQHWYLLFHQLSPNSITPTSPKLPRQGSQCNGIWAKGDVTGLSWTSRGSRYSGIWTLLSIQVTHLMNTMILFNQLTLLKLLQLTLHQKRKRLGTVDALNTQ